MANSDWIEADRIDRLKPAAQRFYEWCMAEMDLKLEPPERYFSIREVKWCLITNKVRARVAIFNKRYPQYFEAYSLEEMKDHLETRGCDVPESLSIAVYRERRLRVSEETLDYWLNSGNSIY